MAKLTYEFHLIKENGEIIDIDKVPEDVKKKMAERLSRTMSAYYTQHPEEFERIS